MAPKTDSAKQAFKAIFQARQYSAPANRSIPVAKQKYIPTTGTYPKGFLVGSSHAGVKASNTKYDDLALVTSEKPCAAAAVFTQNIFKAAPVTVSKNLLYKRQSAGFRGVVVNSGCANAVTGTGGMEDALTMASATDKALGADAGEPSTLVMSTGVIGQRLPIKKITDAIPSLHASIGNTHEHWLGAAQAICTTDTFPKLISRTFTLPSHPETTYSIAGMTKGAGMIHPNMATLLGIVCTDVSIEPASMRSILRSASNRSFNCISIDGDTSTNDTVALFANGAAAPEGAVPLYNLKKNRRDEKRSEPHPDLEAFRAVLEAFMIDLAKLVVRDGEGATKFVTIRVQAANNPNNARRAAVSIATSALVKTALYGKDANWGRILCAIGYAPGIMDSREVPLHNVIAHSTTGARNFFNKKPYEPVRPENTSVSFVPADGSEELKLLVRGEPEVVDEERAKQILEMEDLEILVKLSDVKGKEDAGSAVEEVFWTCDFSHEYVTINGDYRT
jgi:glutamate N-acetyltransferase/amino-acid N-acetyltransferase